MQKTAGKKSAGKLYLLLLSAFILSLLPCALHPALSAEKWPGVDESVVEKIAAEHGRHAREPLINTDQGDLLLFAFLAAGALGGFAAGYYWRILMEGKVKRPSPEEENVK